MAKLILNGFLDRIKGRFGDIVVRKRNGSSFLSRPPTRPDVPPSAAQVDVQNRFKLASAFANSVAGDPVKLAFYEPLALEKKTSVFAVAMSDYLKRPRVTGIELSDYRGQIGDPVTVLATDDTQVMSVAVVIRSAAGLVLEEGAAASADGVWRYTATTALPAGETVTIEAKAKDRPGNSGTLQKPFTA